MVLIFSFQRWRKSKMNIELKRVVCLFFFFCFSIWSHSFLRANDLKLTRITTPFELWCWRRLLRVPWTARRSNQSILKEISPEYSLDGLMLKLKLWYFGHLMRRVDSLEKTLMLGKTEGRRRRRWHDEMVGWHHPLNGHELQQTLGDSDWCLQSMESQLNNHHAFHSVVIS